MPATNTFSAHLMPLKVQPLKQEHAEPKAHSVMSAVVEIYAWPGMITAIQNVQELPHHTHAVETDIFQVRLSSIVLQSIRVLVFIFYRPEKLPQVAYLLQWSSLRGRMCRGILLRHKEEGLRKGHNLLYR